MPAPGLPQNVSLATLRDDLVFTESRLLADSRAASQVKPIRGLLAAWESVQREQLALWDAQTKADALVAAADDALDDFLVRFANIVRAHGGAKAWGLYFKVAPHALAKPVLGEELETLRRWSKLLGSASEAPLKAMKKELDSLVAAADNAVKARTEAAAANDEFRQRGALATYVADVVKKRDATAAALDALAASDEALPRAYGSRFFRSRVTKLSAEAKQAKAEKKAAEQKAKAEVEAAVRAAQAKVKAALAELKAAKKK